MRCTRCQSFACGPCELRLPVAGLRITLGIWRTWSGFLPSLSEPRPCSKPLLGNRLTPVSCCFSFSFMIHDPGCIFSFYLFGSKKWVGRKCSLESHGRTRRKLVSRWREGWQFGNNKQTWHSANIQNPRGFHNGLGAETGRLQQTQLPHSKCQTVH